MIKPFEILREVVTADGLMVLYKVTKSAMTDEATKTKTTVTSTMFVASGLNVEEALATHLKACGWL
jgi:hypothetical protein